MMSPPADTRPYASRAARGRGTRQNDYEMRHAAQPKSAMITRRRARADASAEAYRHITATHRDDCRKLPRTDFDVAA